MKHCQNKTPPKFMYFLKVLLIAKKILLGYWTRDGKMGFGYPKYVLSRNGLDGWR